MNYTSTDLSRLVIKRTLFDGYSKKQVDCLLQKIIEDYREFEKNIHEMKCQINTLNDTVQHYRVLEESLQHSILVAQHTAEQIKTNACDKAKNIVNEAEIKAQKIIEEAANEARKIQAKYDELKNEIFSFKSKSEALLQSQMEVLRQLFDE